MHSEKIKRIIGTDDIHEFIRWISYMRNNDISFRATMKYISHKYDCNMELIGVSKEELEEIKERIGFYLDWGLHALFPFAKITPPIIAINKISFKEETNYDTIKT